MNLHIFADLLVVSTKIDIYSFRIFIQELLFFFFLCKGWCGGNGLNCEMEKELSCFV